jgi:Stress responsive A/B Barrel Domain
MTLPRQTIYGLSNSASCRAPLGLHTLRVAFPEDEMTSAIKRTLQVALGAALFFAGIAAGTLHARSAAIQNRFGQPKTVLHVVVYKFKDNTSNYEREKAINGIKDMAGKIPGIKNVWIKTSRNQIKDFTGVYAIEFTSAEAAADYAESPVHEAWSKTWQEERENSLSFQVTNP